MNLRDIYQSVILDNAMHQQHQNDIPHNNVQSVYLENPTCGDQLNLYGYFDDHQLKAINFHSDGCIIFRASTNMMANLCDQKNNQDIMGTVNNFKSLMDGKEVEAKDIGDAIALKSVSRLPVRIKCAMLPWEGIHRLIQKDQKEGAD